MIRMTKDEFLLVLERQQESGLSIKDFCLNEAYTDSSFYYWKSKFGLTGAKVRAASLPDFAPVNILKSQRGVLTSTPSQTSGGSITIELPNGIKVRFEVENNVVNASGLLTQICSEYVLS